MMFWLFCGLFMFVAGGALGSLIYMFGHGRGLEQGFRDGERYGKTCGYRQAWLKQEQAQKLEDWQYDDD